MFVYLFYNNFKEKKKSNQKRNPKDNRIYSIRLFVAYKAVTNLFECRIKPQFGRRDVKLIFMIFHFELPPLTEIHVHNTAWLTFDVDPIPCERKLRCGAFKLILFWTAERYCLSLLSFRVVRLLPNDVQCANLVILFGHRIIHKRTPSYKGRCTCTFIYSIQ